MDKPVCAQKAPYAFEVEEGKTYYYCTCGLSEKQPICDGKHKGTDWRAQAFTAEKTGTVYLCGCKATKNPPFCDGEHANL